MDMPCHVLGKRFIQASRPFSVRGSSYTLSGINAFCIGPTESFVSVYKETDISILRGGISNPGSSCIFSLNPGLGSTALHTIRLATIETIELSRATREECIKVRLVLLFSLLCKGRFSLLELKSVSSSPELKLCRDMVPPHRGNKSKESEAFNVCHIFCL